MTIVTFADDQTEAPAATFASDVNNSMNDAFRKRHNRIYMAAITDIQIPHLGGQRGYTVVLKAPKDSSGDAHGSAYAHGLELAKEIAGNNPNNTVTEVPEEVIPAHKDYFEKPVAEQRTSATFRVFIAGPAGATALSDLSERTGVDKAQLATRINITKSPDYCCIGMISSMAQLDPKELHRALARQSSMAKGN